MIGSDETYYSADTKIINNQIEARLEQLYECNDLQKVFQEKNDINTYLTKKMKIRAEDSNNAELKELIKQRDSYENDLKSKSEYIYADESGVISYRVDGYEEKLTNSDFSYLNKKYLEDIDIQNSQIIAINNDKSKIVNNFKCNIACVLKSKEASEIEEGKSVKLRLQDAEEIPAKIVWKRDEGNNETLIVFEINTKVEDLIKYRKISFDVIWWSDSCN